MVIAADHGLAAEQFPEMNARFYATQPFDYFSTRLHSLLLIGSRPELMAGALREGLSLGNIKVQGSEAEYATAEELRRYVTIESVVLLHHASEALLRLFFAHESVPGCPWLEIARLRQPREFKNRLSKLLGDDDAGARRAAIARWFLGGDAADVAKRAQGQGASGDALVSEAEHLLLITADRLEKEGNLYNAAKHGLAVLPDERSMTLGAGALDIDLSVSGPSLSYLEAKRTSQRDRNTWHESTTWVDVDRWLTWTHLVLLQMRNLWSIAKLVYLKEPARINPIPPDTVDQVMRRGTKPVNIETMSIELLYYARTAPSVEHSTASEGDPRGTGARVGSADR